MVQHLMQSKKQIIINADDFALDNTMTDGVVNCYKLGTISQTSIITTAKSEYFSYALDKCLKYPELEVGLHVTLCTNNSPYNDYLKPVTENVGFLCDDEGYFKRLTSNFIPLKLGIFNRHHQDIREEVKAQIDYLREHDISINHLNAHCYIEIIPLIDRILTEVCLEEKIPYLRLSYEEDNTNSSWKARAYAGLMRILQAKNKRNRRSNNCFHAHQYLGVGSIGFDRFDQYVRYLDTISLAEGVCELAVHVPVEQSPNKWYRNHREYEFVHSPEFRDLLNENYILTTSKKWLTADRPSLANLA